MIYAVVIVGLIVGFIFWCLLWPLPEEFQTERQKRKKPQN